MTYIPKGTKRHWTAEEESLLAESWGVCGVPALAKKLNRSQQAIKIRASRLHLGPLLMGGDYVTLNQLVTAFNRTGSYAAYNALVNSRAKSYRLDDRELTRFDLDTLSDEIEDAERKVEELTALLNGQSARKAFGVIPRDW